jgi:membrane protein YqaA with SNARE-associated domain
MIESAVLWLLNFLALPAVGLPSIFFVSFVAATVVPMGSEPAVFAVIKANAGLFWPAILVGTIGNTLGGAFDYWLGLTSKKVFAEERGHRWFGWLLRFGPKAMLVSWLPGIGDPLCVLAGWLKLPFWPSVFYMMIGKFLRYVTMTWVLLLIPDGFWHQVGVWLS